MATESVTDPSRFRDPDRQTPSETSYRQSMNQYIAESSGTACEKFENFTKYVSRQTLARFLALYEIFKQVVPVHGDIIECGVNWGAGLMGFAQMSTILEPVNLQRRIIGFDTFSGFTTIGDIDRKATSRTDQLREGGLAADSYEDLQHCIRLYDSNRMIGHIEKVKLIKGDAGRTIPAYLEEHPETVVSLLHLDFDLHEPTKVAIKRTSCPACPKGRSFYLMS